MWCAKYTAIFSSNQLIYKVILAGRIRALFVAGKAVTKYEKSPIKTL